jgi:hypothetical protein
MDTSGLMHHFRALMPADLGFTIRAAVQVHAALSRTN